MRAIFEQRNLALRGKELHSDSCSSLEPGDNRSKGATSQKANDRQQAREAAYVHYFRILLNLAFSLTEWKPTTFIHLDVSLLLRFIVESWHERAEERASAALFITSTIDKRSKLPVRGGEDRAQALNKTKCVLHVYVCVLLPVARLYFSISFFFFFSLVFFSRSREAAKSF